MRKISRAAAVAIGTLAITVSTGAFALTSASQTAATAAKPTAPALASIRPGTPLQPAGGQLAGRASVTTSITRLQSANWAGYAASFGTTTLRYVAAHFTVPYLDCAGVSPAIPTFSAHWVGLDGFRLSSTTVEQVGVLAACVLNSATNTVEPAYAVFFERFPVAPGYPNVTVHAGDSISMSVFFDKSTRVFRFALSDDTDGQHFTVFRTCPSGSICLRNSAEVISEAPATVTSSGGLALLPLADFQAAGFDTTAITTTSGASGGLRSSSWNTFEITQVSDGTNTDATGSPIPVGTPLDNPTPLYQKNTFLNYWRPANS
jgi:Peptidase A4 family